MAVGSDYSNTYNFGFVFLDVMEPYAALCIERMFSRLNASDMIPKETAGTFPVVQ
jgi:hypothetical protein